VAVRASSSYELDGWSPISAIDGVRASVPDAQGWSSQLSVDQRPEWIEVAVRSGQVSRVVLYQVKNAVFPVDFRIQIWNGTAWVDRVVQTDFTPPDGSPQAFSWTPADTTDRVRIYASRLRKAQQWYALQFAEIETLP
jgi:hypothetical protein